MKVPKQLTLTVLTLTIALSATSVSASESHGHRHHEAHVHGIGSLNLAMEGKEVHLELDSPAANIVGFEHAPTNEGERQTLKQAIATLQDGGRLFRFSEAAGCRLVNAEIDTPLAEHHQDGEAHHHADDHHADDRHADDHDHGHEKSKREDHSHEDHEQDAGHDETHSDITAEYRFNCQNPENLQALDVDLFKAFPATERLNVQYVGPRGQGAVTLTASNPTVKF